MIFEWTVQIDPWDWSQTARSISQVCRVWRFIPLSSSFLWSYVTISMGKGGNHGRAVKKIIEMASTRLRSTPAEINIDLCADELLPYAALTLDRFRAIKSLNLDMANGLEALHLLESHIRYSTGYLECLVLEGFACPLEETRGIILAC
jgi:hypothetical protein